jgi:RNA polymerase sigma-70 factor (ECF subfamily)
VSYNEREIIEKCRSGDKNAFEILVKHYEKKVYNMTYRMLGNKEDALDVSQEVFIKIYKSIRSFKGESSFSTWLYRLVTNTCLDEIRKRKGKKLYSIDKPVETEFGEVNRDLIDDSNGPEEQACKMEIQEIVQKAICQLPEEQRIIIILRDIQGFSYKEMAEILQCSMGTVKSRLNRGRLALKGILESSGNLLQMLTSK